MTVKKVNIKDFPKVFKEYVKGLQEVQYPEVIAKAVVKNIPELVRNSPVDQGQYASSWNYEVTNKAVNLGNIAPHAPLIEYGSRPFVPPIMPLLEWASRVLQDPPTEGKYSKQVRSLANGVRWKIATHGMQPKHVLTKQIPKIVEDIKRLALMELKKGPGGKLGKKLLKKVIK